MSGLTKLCIAAAVAAVCSAAPAYAQTSGKRLNETAMSGEQLSASEIRAIYSGKTWRWGRRSGGYFANRRQEFKGVSTDKAFVSFGDGVWFVPRAGRMCFRATWRTGKRTERKLDCFEHRKVGRAIYQRKPGGDWYVFRGARLGPWDEVRKIQPGDRISRFYRAGAN